MKKTCIAVGFPSAELNAMIPEVRDKLSVVGFADGLEELNALVSERVPDVVAVYKLGEGERAEDYINEREGAPETMFVIRRPVDSYPEGVRTVNCINGYGALSRAVKDVQPVKANHSRDRAIDERLQNIFITAGIPPHIKGYQFLREAVKKTVDKPELINNITKELYPVVANRFGTTPSKVERAIRHAIEVAWSRGKIENINNIYGIKIFARGEKPTNGELIALIADKLMIEYSM